jgi:hypothetical protein
MKDSVLWFKDPHHLDKQTELSVLFTFSSLVYKCESYINVVNLHISCMFHECFYTIPIPASQV